MQRTVSVSQECAGGETAPHLDALVHTGRLTVSIVDGVRRWEGI